MIKYLNMNILVQKQLKIFTFYPIIYKCNQLFNNLLSLYFLGYFEHQFFIFLTIIFLNIWTDRCG